MAQKRAAKKPSSKKSAATAKKSTAAKPAKGAKASAVRRKVTTRKSAPAKAAEGLSKTLGDAVRDLGAMVGEGARRLTGTPARSSRKSKAAPETEQA